MVIKLMTVSANFLINMKLMIILIRNLPWWKHKILHNKDGSAGLSGSTNFFFGFAALFI